MHCMCVYVSLCALCVCVYVSLCALCVCVCLGEFMCTVCLGEFMCTSYMQVTVEVTGSQICPGTSSCARTRVLKTGKGCSVSAASDLNH